MAVVLGPSEVPACEVLTNCTFSPSSGSHPKPFPSGVRRHEFSIPHWLDGASDPADG